MARQHIDARGLSCPQPVLLASRENVGRAAQSKGWTVAASEEVDQDFRLVLTK